MKLLCDRLQLLKSRIRESLFVDLVHALRTFPTEVEAQKRANGKLDFDDLLFLSRDLLRDRPEVRSRFQERYRFILVDEFQDTDPIQAELIWHLSSFPGQKEPWPQVALVPGKLFLVGDPKQSIYRFRRADIKTYRHTSKQLASQGEHLVIRQNFRSSGPFIQWINSSFAAILEDSYEELSEDETHLYPSDLKPVWVVEPPSLSGVERAKEIRKLEAESIAALVCQLLKEKKPLVYDRISKNLRPVRLGDIAILFPTTTDIDRFEEQLRRYNLPFSLEGGKMFYGRSEVHAVISALEAIERPTDPIAVVAALKSALFGLSDQDLLKIKISGVGFDYRKTNDKDLEPVASSTYQILRELHRLRFELSPARLISLLFEKTLAIPLALDRFHGEQAASNLEKLLSLARVLEGKGITTLCELNRWFQEQIVGDGEQSEPPTTEEIDSKIRLLTVHKAKGLEFPVVILANLAAARDRGEQVIADRLGNRLGIGLGPKEARFALPGFEDLVEMEKNERAQERKRLLYVAVTRTRDLLILPKFYRGNKLPELWTYLDAGLKASTSWVETISAQDLPFLTTSPEKTREVGGAPSGSYSEERARIEQTMVERCDSWEKGLPIQTPTSMVKAKEISSTPKQAKSSDGAQLGSAFHAVMEKIDFQAPSEAWNLVSKIGLEYGVDEKILRPLVEQFFHGPLIPQIQSAKKIWREVPFSWRSNDILFEGVIDLVLETKEGLAIVDYKTDRVADKSIPERAEHYRPQLQLYAQALEKITNQNVNRLLLYFIRPNELFEFEIGMVSPD